MNRQPLARFLRFAVMSCVLLSCLVTLQTPALAIGIYNNFVQVSFLPQAIPLGTSISFSAGAADGGQFFTGNALATQAALAGPPGSATALVSGFASGASSVAISTAVADGFANVFNANSTTATFPLAISHTRNLNPFSDSPSEVVSTAATYSVAIDMVNVLLSNDSHCVVTCDASGTDFISFGLTPGSHLLHFTVSTSGRVEPSDDISATPEPASLLLLGTTMAGLGFAWRRRKQG